MVMSLLPYFFCDTTARNPRESIAGAKKGFFLSNFCLFMSSIFWKLIKKREVALFRYSLVFCTQPRKPGSASHKEKKEEGGAHLLLRGGPFLAPLGIFSPKKGKPIKCKSQKLIQ